MAGRLIGIGDIHGCSAALDTVLAAAHLSETDTVVTVGDYVDRGPDSAGTIERLLALGEFCHLVPLVGNHDRMLLDILHGQQFLLGDWLAFGGDATLESYGCNRPEEIPEEHQEFLAKCFAWFETDRHFFVHASYDPRKKLAKQSVETFLWQSIRDKAPGPHRSGKIAVVGHTSQKNGEILDMGHLVCIDTWVYGEGWLTAIDLYAGEVWQADKRGRLRER